MEFNNREPIYLQIVNAIKRKIVSREIAVGEKLPSVRELAGELKVNPNTVQRVYAELEREGLVYTRRGMGKYVSEDETLVKGLRNEMARNVLVSFIEKMKDLGFDKEEILDSVKKNI